MIKQYKAVNDIVCIKQFAATLESGWFETTKEALQNFTQVANIPVTVDSRTEVEQETDAPKRRGRPRKE